MLGGRWALVGATRCLLYRRCTSTQESACCVACCRPCGRLCACVWYVVGVWRVGREGSERRAQPTVAAAVEEELLKPAAPPPPLWLAAPPPLAPSATHAPAHHLPSTLCREWWSHEAAGDGAQGRSQLLFLLISSLTPSEPPISLLPPIIATLSLRLHTSRSFVLHAHM